MKVKLAKTAGFCMGVRRAMEMVLAEANKGKGELFTFGPLIHNTQVIDLLASKGVVSIQEPQDRKSGRIVIRAHGIPPEKRKELKNTGMTIIDATCPRVVRVQAIIRYNSRKGKTTIIVGDKKHAEVIGLMGFAEGPLYVIQSKSDVAALPPIDHAFVVAQTTQNEENYREVVDALKNRFSDILVFNTICGATRHRQKEVRSLTKQVDAMVVVGGRHSSNTRRLVEISQESGLPTFHVETERDLKKSDFQGMQNVGLTAGASTPNWMIKNVFRRLEGIRGRRETSLVRWVRRAFKFVVLSNLFVASAVFCLAYAVSILLEKETELIFPLLASLYVYAMHTLNRFLDKGAGIYNDPDRAAFLKRNRYLLILTAVIAIVLALVLSYTIGRTTFYALTALCILGIIYSVPLVPEVIQHKFRYSKIKDIPGSRSLSEALAWVAVIVVLPLFGMDRIVWSSTLIAMLVVFKLSYTRSALFDIFQAQGDLIVGIETLPITLGEKRTIHILKIVLLTTAAILIGGPLLELSSAFSYFLLVSGLALYFCLIVYETRWLYTGITLEALVEGSFFPAGILALVWQAF